MNIKEALIKRTFQLNAVYKISFNMEKAKVKAVSTKIAHPDQI